MKKNKSVADLKKELAELPPQYITPNPFFGTRDELNASIKKEYLQRGVRLSLERKIDRLEKIEHKQQMCDYLESVAISLGLGVGSKMYEIIDYIKRSK